MFFIHLERESITHGASSITTVDNQYHDETDKLENTLTCFRPEMVKSIMKDKILTDIISEHVLNSYSNDLVRTLCIIIEKNFSNDFIQCESAINFVSRWLLLIDYQDEEFLEQSENRYIWLLAHVYAALEYEPNDLISFYSACRITDRLDRTKSFYNDIFSDGITRSEVRATMYRKMFDYLWKNLCLLCSSDENSQQWIDTYIFISKYYPSDKVLGLTRLVDIKDQIEFMKLAYLILLNEATPEPTQLINCLLKDTNLIQGSGQHQHSSYETSISLKHLSKIIESIHRYFERQNANISTLMIDLQQWILSILKTSNQSCINEIKYLFEYLNKTTCQLSLAMKQFLFDELANLFLERKQQNELRQKKSELNPWDRMNILLIIIVECALKNDQIKNYKIPSHPSIVPLVNRQQSQYTLFDLLFFYLRRYMNDYVITVEFLHKGLMLESPVFSNKRMENVVRELFKQLRDYFLLRLTGLFLCQTDVKNNQKKNFDGCLSEVIRKYLPFDKNQTEFTQNLHLFLATIISKRSWNYLLDLLKSNHVLHLNTQWASSLQCALESKDIIQRNICLEFCQQIQFTLSSKNTSSVFPKLHQPYQELSQHFDTCVKNNNEQQRWKPFSNWMISQLTSNSPEIQPNEMKAMLLLKIYYDYYCNDKLELLGDLLTTITNTLQLINPELQVFRAFLQPLQYMIGYPQANILGEDNFLNSLFRVDCKDDDELCMRHTLVNLMAMILIGGKQSFLWTFAFEPLKLQNTFGFGSTAHHIITATGVHYDCGCVINYDGALVQFTNRAHPNPLTVPAVYVVYFSTFGALAWHLLLFNESVENLYGPILAKHAIDYSGNDGKMVGGNLRAKVCHFVRARILSTFHFLSIRSNQDEACILLNRCFEQMAFLTCDQRQHSWIKPFYTTLVDVLKAEQEYQNQIFYPIYQKLAEYKTYVNSLQLESQLQTNLQDYIIRMPMIIHFLHFKTELGNPSHSKMPLNILRNLLNSTDFLKMTKIIYDLSQFYILLNYTYTQLIERDEFTAITLRELYERGQKRFSTIYNFDNRNENNNHMLIIENGIKAVNIYHKFTDGLIQPGACDETQRFFIIGHDTLVSYLVTTGNNDEGDIIMRIIRVLVDYHNSLLISIENEMDSENYNGHHALKTLVKEMASKEISVLQIGCDNHGVITLNDNDCYWIEKLSQASLKCDEEYFPTASTQLDFDFLYVQSYIIRTYLLHCRINYRQIDQKYQCYIRRKAIDGTTTSDIDKIELDDIYSVLLNHDQLETEWSYLKEMPLDKLYEGRNLLRQITVTLQHYSDDLSQKSLYEFVRMIDNENNLLEQLKQCEIKNFQLCYITNIRDLYEKSMNDFQYLFTDVSHLLRVPLDTGLSFELNQMLKTGLIDIEYKDQVDKLQAGIQMITDLLNVLQKNEAILLHQSTQSLKETCEILMIENSILSLLPDAIKCENYVPVNIQLIQVRSILQERTITISEIETNIWNEHFDTDFNQQQNENRFHQYINATYMTIENADITLDSPDEPYQYPPESPISENGIEPDLEPESIVPDDDDIFPEPKPNENIIDIPDDPHQEKKSPSISIRSVPLTSSVIAQNIHEQQEQVEESLSKPRKFAIHFPDGESTTHLWRAERLYEQLNRIFDEKGYDLNSFVVVDNNQIFIDFINNNRLPRRLTLQYHIIKKDLLIPIHFYYKNNSFKYLVTSNCEIANIVDHFVGENNLRPTSSDVYLCFFDEFGKIIESGKIEDILKVNNNLAPFHVTVEEMTSSTNTLCEITIQWLKGKYMSASNLRLT
ncbi:unnamed protein product [Rotaria sp. Silwood2]|nr:unnamed protein product [Rotaria sp. Silwood2]